MMTTKKSQAKRWMQRQLAYEPEEYDDCGEVQCTKLAETCANELDLCLDDADATIPEWVFDMAVDVAEENKNNEQSDSGYEE